MFNWFRAWRRRRQEQKTRAIFEYWDGRNFRKLDPWKAHRDIQADPDFNMEAHIELACMGSEPEVSNCIKCVCKVFGVERYDPKTGRGLTDGELLDLIAELLDYLEALQKKTRPGPTLSPATDLPPSTSQEPQNEITNSSSPLPSTSVEPNSGEVSPSPTESSTGLPV